MGSGDPAPRWIFLASDNPVSLVRPRCSTILPPSACESRCNSNIPNWSGGGAGWQRSDGPDGYHQVDHSIVDHINLLVASSADQWIIAARKDEAESVLFSMRFCRFGVKP